MACSYAEGQKVAQEICKVMGLDPTNVYKCQIICEAGNLVKVEIGRYLEEGEAENLKGLISKYILLPSPANNP